MTVLTELNRMIRLADLPKYTGIQRTQIDELIKKGEFPKAIRLSDTGRAKAWLECDVLAWQNARILKAHTEDPSAPAELTAKARAAKAGQAVVA